MTTHQIARDQVHVWCANMRNFDFAVPALWSVLSPGEHASAERFRFPRERDDYIIRHGMLRILLGAYVGESPSGLSFTTSPSGKPELRTCCGEGAIHFNLSHSRDVALFGITGACPIGLDVEYIQPIPHCERIAREFFFQTEAESLMDLPAELRVERFYELWTRKEALVKATGDGLGNGLSPDSAPLFRLDASKLTEPSPLPGASDEWHIRSFSPRPGYMAAVAFSKPDLDLTSRSVPVFFSGESQGCDRPALRYRAGT